MTHTPHRTRKAAVGALLAAALTVSSGAAQAAPEQPQNNSSGMQLNARDDLKSKLTEGKHLHTGDQLVSPNRRTTLSMLLLGNLVLETERRGKVELVWESGTFLSSYATVSKDGQLVIMGYWDNELAAFGPKKRNSRDRAELELRNGGELVLKHGNREVWNAKDGGTPDDPDDPGNPDPEPDPDENHNGDRVLKVGEFLGKGDVLNSRNGDFQLKFKKNGNVILRDTDSRDKLWSTQTNGKRKAREFKVLRNGNLVLEDKRGRILWETGTEADRPRNPRLVLENNGELKLKHGRDVVWSNKGTEEQNERKFVPGDQLRSREQIFSDNGRYKLKLRKNGQLILRDTDEKETVWKAGTRKSGAQKLVLRKNGNLVLLDKDGDEVWETDTGRRNARKPQLLIRNDGTLELIVSGESVWRAP